jgi:hypothetical protein
MTESKPTDDKDHMRLRLSQALDELDTWTHGYVFASEGKGATMPDHFQLPERAEWFSGWTAGARYFQAKKSQSGE